MQRQNSLELTSKMQFFKTVLAGAAMLFVGCHGYVPLPYPVKSDLTSGSLVAAAGSIGIVALAASAALATMSSLQISKDCNCKRTSQTNVPVTEPGPSCEDLLETERQRCEQEKGELEEENQDAFDLFGRTVRAFCDRIPTAGNCVECLEYFEDEAECDNSSPPCNFDDGRGVCSILDPSY